MATNLKKIKETFSLQNAQNSCGLACLVSISKLYGKATNEEQLKIYSGTTIEGTTLLGLRNAARSLGFASDGYEGDIYALEQLKSVAILHVINDIYTHYIICYGYDQKSRNFIIGDPAKGILFYSENQLSSIWRSKTFLTLLPNSTFEHDKKNYSEEKKALLNNLISPDTHILLITFFLSLFTSSITFATAIFSQKLIDEILPSKNINRLFYFIALYSIIIIIGTILSYSRNILIIRQTKMFNSRLIRTFLAKIFSLPVSFFNSMRVGEIICRMKETEHIQGAIIVLINSTLVECMTLFFAILILMYYNIEIALIATLSIPVMICLSKYFSVKIKNRQKELMINYADFEAHSVESISGIQCIKNYIQEPFFTNRLQFQYDAAQETAKRLGNINSKYDFTINILSSFFSIISMFIGAYYVIIEKLEVGQLFAIITILSLIIVTTINIISVIIQIQESIVAFERLHDIISSNNEKTIISNGDSIVKESSSKLHILELRNVSFSYTGEKELLNNVNIKISTGEFVSLFGDIGTGKSTLLYLIQRFYPIKSGSIFFDNYNISKYSISNWRSNLSVVSQNTKIFIGTVADNITMFRSEDFNRLKQFCIDLELNYFLELGPLNLLNLLNENGINLSGGQKQLIGFARALFAKSKILILDEPTASMDKGNELMMIKILHKIKKEKIIIMITHKPEIARKTDRIFVLERKRIIGAGTHEELIKENNIYSKYHALLFE